MEKRIDDLQQRLQTSQNNQWSTTFSTEIHRLSSSLSTKLPIYQASILRENLIASVKIVQEFNINSAHNELYSCALTNYLLLLSIHTHKLVSQIFLDRIYDIKAHLAYWKEHDHTRFGFIDQIKTTFWFDNDRDDIRTSEKIKFLSKQESYLSNAVGHFAYTVANLEQQDQINLELLMNSTNELNKILTENTLVNYNVHSDLSDVLELYSQILSSFEEYQLRWIETTNLYYRPTHLKRYLPYYVGLTAFGCYTLYRVYTNREQIVSYVFSTYGSLKFFVDEHLIVPLKTIYSSTFESRASQEAYENSQMNYINSKKILAEMLEEYGRQHAGELARINNISKEAFLSTLSERAKNEDMNVVMKYYQQELDRPIRSAMVGDLIKGILIQVQKVKVDGEGLVIQIDQLMKQNEINFSLLATFPAILLISFLIVTTKNVIANRFIKQRKFDLSTLRQRIISKLREIEQLLVLNSETPSLAMGKYHLVFVEKDQDEHNADDLKMTKLAYGRFLFLMYELKDFTDQLNSRRMLSKEINGDINLLTHTQLSVQQKLLIIQQIHHSYSFLVH